jgi:hypothetical protein
MADQKSSGPRTVLGLGFRKCCHGHDGAKKRITVCVSFPRVAAGAGRTSRVHILPCVLSPLLRAGPCVRRGPQRQEGQEQCNSTLSTGLSII